MCEAVLRGDQVEESNDARAKRIKRYAADGVLHYAAKLSKEFNVIAVAISGEKEHETLFSAFLHPKMDASAWRPFALSQLFDIKKGKRLTKANMAEGEVPFIGSIDGNNGVSNFVGQEASHPGNTLTVNYNGSVAEAFYQAVPYRCSDDVNALYPKFEMTPAIGLFLATLIRREKYRFNYGRKWHLDRMTQSTIRLPVKDDGAPDWEWIENYIKTLAFSAQL